MNAVQVDDFDKNKSLSPYCLGLEGDPKNCPRVGEEYQAEIPSLISKSDYYLIHKKPQHDADSTHSFHKYQVRLPIPTNWIKDEHDQPKHTCKSIRFSKSKYTTKETHNSQGHDKLNPEHEAIGTTLVNRTKVGVSRNSNVLQETQNEIHKNNKWKGYSLVPESSTEIWNEIEKASLILALYIFGKNLVLVKRFIGNKTIEDILAFYYGNFYKSDTYRRWHRRRKMKDQKCIYGQKIFTGPGEQELLSRLLPNVSEECRSKLLEVSKTSVEGKMTLEDYILTIKDSVGLSALVGAVGIGKKNDLTCIKSTPICPEIPVGKDCAKLTPAEIISLLTGDYRLSKARTSDIFWEAVWPRLLARGWHSEQLGGNNNNNYGVFHKNTLFFIIPGVEKFSKELVKGNHYFDSVSDVLAKVASDPELIELETVPENDGTNTKETKLDQEDSSDQQHHCHLKLLTPDFSTEDLIKFIIVDTSLGSEMVKELRSLPVGVMKDSTSEDDSENEDSLEEKQKESAASSPTTPGMNDGTNARKLIRGKGVSSNIIGKDNNPSKEVLPMRSIGSTNPSTSSKNKKTDLLSNKERRDAMNSKNVIVPTPVLKRQRRPKCH